MGTRGRDEKGKVSGYWGAVFSPNFSTDTYSLGFFCGSSLKSTHVCLWFRFLCFCSDKKVVT